MKRTSIYFIIVCLLALCGNGGQIMAQQSGAVAIIVNPSVPVDSISMADLKKIFSGDKSSWGNGVSITPFVRSNPAHERDVLLKIVMKMTDAQYQDFWVKKVYSGSAAHEPLALMTNSMQLDAVRSQKGGIALINLQEVKDGVKVLKLDGALPGEAGYALR